ncbi:MAG: hypothetical protein IJS46_06225 [Kiritimatiellae bacterium]|nr:hypothetical protein [Kiritimatiellia bacterium]
MKMQNIAHRGIWDEAIPQNTLEAFRRAWQSGATWVETDFHHVKSGQIVCIHVESELKAYTGCEKQIADLTPDDIASLRLVPPGPAAPPPSGRRAPPPAGTCGPFRIPLLGEVLATVPPHGTLQAEIKGYSPQYADLFDAAVRDAGLSEANIVVSSFQFDALADFHRRLPSYRTLWLASPPVDAPFDSAWWISRCRDGGFGGFCPGCGQWGGATLSPEDADAIRAAGIEFRLWGVNAPESLRYARDLGAAGFTCNYWHAAFDWAAELGGVELLP